MNSNKALVAFVVTLLVEGGINPDGPVGKAIVGLILAAAVWIVPNINRAK